MSTNDPNATMHSTIHAHSTSDGGALSKNVSKEMCHESVKGNLYVHKPIKIAKIAHVAASIDRSTISQGPTIVKLFSFSRHSLPTLICTAITLDDDILN